MESEQGHPKGNRASGNDIQGDDEDKGNRRGIQDDVNTMRRGERRGLGRRDG